MSTDDRIRRASEEIDRATASLTPPPMDRVLRSAQMRTFGVAAAAAIGALVLVGGAVLALSPGGETLPGPAGPSEPTTTTVQSTASESRDPVPVRAGEAGPAPLFDTGQLGTQLPAVFPASAGADIERALVPLEQRGEGLRFGDVEAITLGSGRGVRGYVLVGDLRGRITESRFAYCTIFVTDTDLATDCVAENEPPRFELASPTSGTFALLGALPDDASVVALELGEQRVWTLARDGFVFMVRPDRSEPPVVTVYNADGEVLPWNEGLNGQPEAIDTTAAVEANGSCSGASYYPETYPRADLPEPVEQTVGQIVLFGSRCWFDELEDVGVDNLNASFGGDDPSELWTYEEEQGYEPMRWLMSILDLPHATVDTENGTLYVWPAASAHQGDWATTPAAAVEDLQSLYTDDQMQGFADFGAYIGYRVGIWENGDWSFFVAGD